jgi:hypothetical protein
MVVDDEVGVQELVRGAFLDSETVVIGARNSRMALDLLEDLSCDLMLVESCLPLSREQVLVPVKPGDRYQKKRSESFLKKPFTEDELVEFISKCIE